MKRILIFIIMLVGMIFSGHSVLNDSILYYSFDENNSSFSAYGGVTGSEGIFDGAYNFDGTDDYISNEGTNKNPLYNVGSGDFSFSVWVNPDTSQSKYILYFGTEESGNEDGIVLRLSSNFLVFGVTEDTTGTNQVVSTFALNTSQWYNVIGLRNSGVLKLYINGVQNGGDVSDTSNLDSTNFKDRFLIGSQKVDGGSYQNFFDGKTDEVAIYDRVLSITEITNLYQSGTPTQTADNVANDYIFYAPLNSLYDYSNNSNQASAYNGVTIGDGILNTGFSFDGIDDYISLNSNTFNSDEITINSWVNLDAGVYSVLYTKGGSSTPGANVHLTVYVGTSDTLTIEIGDGVNKEAESFASSGLQGVGWKFLTIQYSNSENFVKVFVDGSQIGTTQTNSISMSTASATSYIGRWATSSSTYNLEGSMDEFSVYNRILSSTEIQTLYANSTGYNPYTATTPTFTITTNTQTYYNSENISIDVDTSGLTNISYYLNNNDIINNNSLVAYYQSENNANDRLGTYNGTESGGTSYTLFNSSYGYAWNFDGINSKVVVGDIGISGDISVSLWVYTGDDAQGSAGVISSGDLTTADYFQIDQNGGRWRLRSNVDRYFSDTIPLNEWTNLAFTVNSVDGLVTYINGVEYNTFSSPISFIVDNLKFGINRGDSSYFNGLVDDVMIYDRTLNSTEIYELYSNSPYTVSCENCNTSTINLNNLDEGSNDLNLVTPQLLQTESFIIDTIAPSINLNFPNEINYNDQLLNLTDYITITDATSTTCNVNVTEYLQPLNELGTCGTSQYTFSVLGNATVEVYVTDSAGNIAIDSQIIDINLYRIILNYISKNSGNPITNVSIYDDLNSFLNFTIYDPDGFTNPSYVDDNNLNTYASKYRYFTDISIGETYPERYIEDITIKYSLTGNPSYTATKDVYLETYNGASWSSYGLIASASGTSDVTLRTETISLNQNISGIRLRYVTNTDRQDARLYEIDYSNVISTDSGENSYYIYYVNPNELNKTVIFQKNNYVDYEYNLTKNESVIENVIIGLTPIFTFNLFDERLLTEFNISSAESITMSVICSDDTTQYYTINSTLTNVPISCLAEKLRFNLQYIDDTGYRESYFRTLKVSENELNRSIYLIDLSTTTAVQVTFSLFDLLNDYLNPYLSVKKNINGENYEIHGDYADASNSVTVYLIKGDEYILQIDSDNLPTRSLGYYTAYQSITQSLTLFELAFSIGENSPYGNIKLYSYIQNGTLFGIFNDLTNTTTEVTITVRENNKYGTIIYSDLIEDEYTGAFSFDSSAYENETLYVQLELTNLYNTYTDVRQLQENDFISIGNIKNIIDMDWVITILLGFVALTLTAKTASSGAFIISVLAALFATFGWYSISWIVLSFAIALTMFNLIREGEKK